MHYHHTHTDDRLTVGCPACAEYVKADQAAAELAAAPLRRCTWTARYNHYDPKTDSRSEALITFSRVDRVVPGWTADEVHDQYADAAFEEFSMKLPDDWSWDQYDVAHDTAVLTVKIGDVVVPDVTQPSAPALDVPLFDTGAA